MTGAMTGATADDAALALHAHFSIFRTAAPERIHLAAHSHHYWPDAACHAQAQAVVDAARHADAKWEGIFGSLIPRVQAGIAAILNLPDPTSLAFAPNTHAFVLRLLSALPTGRAPRILTSDAEFHSFARQVARLAEDGLVVVDHIPALPHETFAERFREQARALAYDLIFVSQVFYNSGATSGDIEALVAAVPSPDTLIVIDGYHGFCALPTNLAAVAGRVFYLAGGYKYAMAGEGACFLHCPPGYAPRPRDTGWFAGFGDLSAAGKDRGDQDRGDQDLGDQDRVGYGADGSRFMGATFDPSGLYRMAAVFDWMGAIGLTIPAIHAHVMALQSQFLDGIAAAHIAALGEARLLTPLATTDRGHFLSFETPQAEAIHDRLRAASIMSDVRGDRIRFGFACYHTPDDIAAAVRAMAHALA